MKLYFNKPKDNWLSPYTIIERIIFWRKIDYDEPLVKNIIKYTQLGWVCDKLHSVRRFINRDIKYVKIDAWDTWSMDSTLSPIILPMLKQLKKHKHGSPHVDDADVPSKLRSTANPWKVASGQDVHKISEDPKFHRRWDYVMDEMIWTFEQLCMDDHEAPFYDHSLAEKEKDITKSYKLVKVDRVGLKKHNQRLDNGLRLFGKYFRALWD
jgi:hypothetical protein